MSRQIDLDKKLNDEDRAYLMSRGRRYLVIQNDRRFASQSTQQDAPPSAPQRTANPEWEAQVNELTVAELRDELSNRGLDTKGNQETLRKRLIEAGPEA
jgi:hypothetical protein